MTLIQLFINIFSQSVACFFNLLTVSPIEQTFYFWWSPVYQFFRFVHNAFGIVSKHSPKSQRFFLCFLLKDKQIYVFHLHLWSELMFCIICQVLDQGSFVLGRHMDAQLFQYHLLVGKKKKLILSSVSCLCTFVKNQLVFFM